MSGENSAIRVAAAVWFAACAPSVLLAQSSGETNDCMRYAAQPLPDRLVRAVLETVDRLDTVTDAGTLVDHLIAPAVS
jgi:hypothetical protein